ncbi:MAG TPA: alpha/beta hydrolase [Blastocatellia bacterium]|nr:alpha/beta hydrolase [Blastocatellia bacterium]
MPDSTRCRRYALTMAAITVLFGAAAGFARAEQPRVAHKTTAAAVEVTEKWVTLFGVKIYYQEAGQGPVVILLHGLGGDSTNWAATIGPLSEHFRVLVPDQVGFGKSDKPLISYRVGTYVDFLDAFYKELKIGRASLVGNSLGGWISAAFAIAHPDKVDRLILVDAAGFALPKDPVAAGVARSLNTSTRQGVKDILPLVFYNTQLYASDVAIDTFFTRRLKAGDGYTVEQVVESVIRGEDVLDNKLSGVKAPTLIVWGREDRLTTLAGGERFNKEIAGSRLKVIDKCGHVPQIEKAAEFNGIVLGFLNGAAGK